MDMRTHGKQRQSTGVCVNSPPVALWLGNVGSVKQRAHPEPLGHLGIVLLSKVIITTYVVGCCVLLLLEAGK
jgi:hypothetical protein